MNQYILKHSTALSKILKDHDVDKDIISSANNHVEEFIKKRGLILFGGTAIDMALRLVGSNIYEPDTLSDYDILSSNSVDDAYDLAEILYKLGFENVKVIRAIHVETMRVRCNLISVVDIGYIPHKFYERIKTINYKGLTVVHTDFQRIDLHRAFCYPYNNAPQEDIFNRWEKDNYRFSLINKFIPTEQPSNDIDIKKVTIETKINLLDKNRMIGGFVAYIYYLNEFKKIKNPEELNIGPDLSIESLTNSGCVFTMPRTLKDEFILIASDDSTQDDKYEGELYSTILNIIPKHRKIQKNVTIYYSQGLCYNVINNNNVVSIQFLLLYFIFMYNTAAIDNDIYLIFYNNLLKMIEHCGDNELFLPSLKLLHSYSNYIPSLYQDPKLPINYNPHKEGTRKIFNYDNFKISGEQIG